MSEVKVAPSPAKSANPFPADFKRIPMSVPQQKLAVPELVGYHMHWHKESNVPRAQQGGYQFVTQEEIPVNQLNVATEGNVNGSQSLDSTIRIVSGRGENGSPEMLVLMKVREDWWLEDQSKLVSANTRKMQAIFGDEALASEQKYSDKREITGPLSGIREENRPLLNRKVRKAKIVS